MAHFSPFSPSHRVAETMVITTRPSSAATLPSRPAFTQSRVAPLQELIVQTKCLPNHCQTLIWKGAIVVLQYPVQILIVAPRQEYII